MISIGVIGNDVEYRIALQYMLSMLPEYRIVGIWGNVESAVPQLALLSPDVVLIDMDFPGKEGVSSINKLKSRHTATFFIVLSTSDDIENILEVLKAGGTGYLLKDDGVEVILRSLRELLGGAVPMSKRVARKVVEHFHKTSANYSHYRLTEREKEILDWLALGKEYKEIASELGITLETLKKHVRNIYSKLQVQNRTEAINKWRL